MVKIPKVKIWLFTASLVFAAAVGSGFAIAANDEPCNWWACYGDQCEYATSQFGCEQGRWEEVGGPGSGFWQCVEYYGTGGDYCCTGWSCDDH
jgi:hypothetical protein